MLLRTDRDKKDTDGNLMISAVDSGDAFLMDVNFGPV